MQNLNARIDSFKPRGRRAGFPHQTSTHPNLSPDRLARAGFYFAPEKKGDDTAVCFCCNSALGGWEPEDDPFAEHVRKDCAYADVVCRPAVEKAGGSSQQPTYPPESSEMTERRKQTFKDWWPHKAKRGWKPTVDALAKAGFYYAAAEGSEDMVQCAYCGYAAEGWEAEDDPYELHLSRNPNCRFFMGQGQVEAIEEAPAPKPKAKGRQTKAATARGRATRAGTVTSEAGTCIEAVAESETVELVDEDAESSAPSTTVTTAKRGGRKPRATAAATTTTAKKARKPRGKKAADAASEIAESEADNDVPEPSLPAAQEGDVVVLVQESEPEQGAPKPKKRGRPRKSELARRATEAAGLAARDAEGSDAIQSSEAQPKQSSRSAPASRRVRASNSVTQVEKPLPALPREPEIPQENQLKAFATLPPTSPWDTSAAAKASAVQSGSGSASLDVPTPKAQRPTRPLRNSPRTNLPRDVLDRSIEAGAKGARQILSDLVNSPLTDVLSPAAAQTTPKASQSGQPPSEADIMAPLTEEQKKMTLEDLIRLEFANGRERMKAQGEEMIRAWQEKAAEDRRRIAAL